MAAALGSTVASEGQTFDRLAYRLLSGIRRWVSRDFSADELYYLEVFARLASDSDVFTLNYDVTIEEACLRAGVACTTGFAQTDCPYPFPPHRIQRGIWHSILFDPDSHLLRLGKLHGSIRWYLTRSATSAASITDLLPDALTQTISKDADSLQKLSTWHDRRPSPILFGGTGKLPAFEPYLTLYRRFVECVESADVLAVIGCRWQVEPIVSEAIGNAARRQSDPLRVLEVTAGDGEDSPQLLRGGARDAVLSGRLKKAVLALAESRAQMLRITSQLPASLIG
jgi:hypothetical protein